MKPIIERVFAIQEFEKASERLRSGRTRGKLVVTISESER